MDLLPADCNKFWCLFILEIDCPPPWGVSLIWGYLIFIRRGHDYFKGKECFWIFGNEIEIYLMHSSKSFLFASTSWFALTCSKNLITQCQFTLHFSCSLVVRALSSSFPPEGVDCWCCFLGGVLQTCVFPFHLCHSSKWNFPRARTFHFHSHWRRRCDFGAFFEREHHFRIPPARSLAKVGLSQFKTLTKLHQQQLGPKTARLPGEGVEKLPGGGFWVPLSSQVGKLCVWPSLRKLFRLLVIGLTGFCQSIKHVWGMGDWEGEKPVSWWESRFLCNGKREIVPLNWKFPCGI